MRFSLVSHILLLIVTTLIVFSAGNTLAEEYSENKIKALFIYKITKFIEWPNAKVSICFIEDKTKNTDSISENLKEVLKKQNNNIIIIQNYDIFRPRHCDIVFINNNIGIDFSDILVKTSGKKIVTMSDIKSFSRRGGIFSLITDGSNKVSVELNYKNALDNQIKISTNLLELIKVIAK